ncbi:GNAT family N-acetyltransferase [Macrococcoides caseolyticum]|uniref:GNAT family N-acetyltransferase n=1 Tax=Macrococcoides caseolyticum TaxID=69966 RepID=UPI001F3D5FF1|nr:GNAT family N-acetyltransferase [Macrococcus caseolyticus]MCE4957654.1 N-acetyltransferase [Macrococcus caseolyticus]
MMYVHRKDNLFYIGDISSPKGQMTYVENGDQLIIDHTEVIEALQGEGAGKQMVEAAVKYARDNNKKILPICSFVKKVIEETPEFQDVL